MQHEIKVRYPVPAAAVIKAFTDPAFHKAKLEALGVTYAILEQKSDGKMFRIRVERRMPINAPAAIKKLLPAESVVVNDESWNIATKTGGVTAYAQGVPVTLSCSVTIRDEGPGSVLTYDWDIAARVPVVGGLLERFVVTDLEARFAEEAQATAPLLARYKP